MLGSCSAEAFRECVAQICRIVAADTHTMHVHKGRPHWSEEPRAWHPGHLVLAQDLGAPSLSIHHVSPRVVLRHRSFVPVVWHYVAVFAGFATVAGTQCGAGAQAHHTSRPNLRWGGTADYPPALYTRPSRPVRRNYGRSRIEVSTRGVGKPF